MQGASLLTGMHPQTLRKYERVGLLVPARSKMARLYSEEDIARLKVIKCLVNEVGLNMAGVGLVLGLRDKVLAIKKELAAANACREDEERLGALLDDMLQML